MFEYEPGREGRWASWANTLMAPDRHQIQEEVERECRGRIALIGLPGVGKSTLFNFLRGWDVSPVSNTPEEGSQEDLGVFRLVDLPDSPLSLGWGGYGGEGLGWPAVADAALVVFVLDATVGVRPAEYGWLSWARAMGRPLVTVLNKVDEVGDGLPGIRAGVEQRLAEGVLPISALTGQGVSQPLVGRMLRASPAIAVALGRELPMVRREAAGLLIQQATLWATLLGAQPIPLLDAPAQLATQQRLLMRLAAMYGQPLSDGRQGVATLAGAFGGRLLAQQLAKLVPVLGWGISAAISGTSTWALGWGAVTWHEREAGVAGVDRGALGLPEGVQAVGRRLQKVRHRATRRLSWPLHRPQGGMNDVETLAGTTDDDTPEGRGA